jgi:diaminopimelate epimerase
MLCVKYEEKYTNKMQHHKINFTKMHGLGNDFVIINHADLPIELNINKLAKNISDRNLGIGCDQFIIYKQEQNHYNMMIYNQDGSSARMCGNASRCLAKLIYYSSGDKNITIKISDRILECEVFDTNFISVNMGYVSFNETWMPAPENIYPIAEIYMIDLKEIICVDVGNPHLVIFGNLSAQDKQGLGKNLQDNNLFDGGVNVNFATIKNDSIYLSVWERGVGFTLACGSGACASFAASVKRGFVKDKAEVIFKYGSLNMLKNKGDIIMSGPASFVCSGEFYYE